MSMNPPRPPDPTSTKITKAVRSALHGQEVAIGMVIGIFLSALLIKLFGG